MKTEITQQAVYDMAISAFGVVPGIVKELAGRSEIVAYIFTNSSKIIEQGTFTFKELNVIELKISTLNNCTSCIKGHTYLLKKEGLDEGTIQAIIDNKYVDDARLNTLIRATENIFFAGSNKFPMHVVEDLNESLTEREIVEIIGIIGIKTMANYTNNYLASLNSK